MVANAAEEMIERVLQRSLPNLKDRVTARVQDLLKNVSPFKNPKVFKEQFKKRTNRRQLIERQQYSNAQPRLVASRGKSSQSQSPRSDGDNRPFKLSADPNALFSPSRVITFGSAGMRSLAQSKPFKKSTR